MKERIKRARKLMAEKELEALIIDSDTNRFYLTGFTGTAGRVLFTPGHNYFITDFRYTEQAREQTDGFEILEISRDVEEKLADILKKESINKLGFESKVITFKQYNNYKDKFDDLQLVATEGLIEKLRVIKDQSEIKKIQKAIDITDEAFNHILDFITPGLTEREVALELEFFMKKQGGNKVAFDFIVASGQRSSMPHGVASQKKLEKGDFITIDFGITYQGYCSDLTRTVILGEATKKQRKIYDTVLKAQLAVIDQVKAGMTAKEVDAIARDIINEAGYKDNFGHGLGHGVGIEVHEDPRVSYTSDATLKSGMVITDEPGIYLPEWGGVRIEDDLLITDDGCRVLNNSPKDLIVL